MSDRTRCPESFPRAVAAVDQVLAENEAPKRGKWKKQDVIEHADHAETHLWAVSSDNADHRAERTLHLSHGATRALMALELHLQEQETSR